MDPALSTSPPWLISLQMGSSKDPGCPTLESANTKRLVLSFTEFWSQRLICPLWKQKYPQKMLKWSFPPKFFLLLHSFWAEQQSQLSCSFVLIARKEFLCFNYKKTPEKNFFCPLGALSIAISQVGLCFSSVMGLLQSNYPSLPLPELTLKHDFSPLCTTVLCILKYPSILTGLEHQSTENCNIVQNSADGAPASDGFISFPLFWNERCHGSHLVQHSTIH